MFWVKSFLWPCFLASFLFTIYSTLSVSAEEPSREPTIGERFHKETSLTWRDIVGDLFRSKPERPLPYKTYPESKTIQMPVPDHIGIPLEEAMAKRRSVRNYSPEPVRLKQLSQLLFAAQGGTGKIYGQSLRTAPSAGALYPFEIYLAVHHVEGLAQGIYHYGISNHELELVRKGDFRKEMIRAGLKQEMLGDNDVTFVLAAVFDRIRHKYGERGFRYIYIEAGHISQNISLQAVSLGLGSVSVGAFLDREVNEIIGLDGRKEAAVYLHAVGTQ
jgi:SagB-type dehydrogenase family enzyme